MERGKRVLVATDGSHDAAQAIDWLADFPLPADAAVEVVTAVRLPFPMDQVVALGWQDLLAESERVVAEARRRLEKRWAGVSGHVLEGDARNVVVDAATKAGSPSPRSCSAAYRSASPVTPRVRFSSAGAAPVLCVL